MIINFPIANGNNSHNLNYHYIDTLWGLGKIQNPLLAFSSAELLEKAMEREINLWTAPTLPLLIIFAGPMVDFPLCSKLIILSSIFEIKKWQMGIPRFFGAISDEPLLRLILGDACWHCSSQVFSIESWMMILLMDWIVGMGSNYQPVLFTSWGNANTFFNKQYLHLQQSNNILRGGPPVV
jgi:hypothetical protein